MSARLDILVLQMRKTAAAPNPGPMATVTF
jgi:hypothetical protein